MPIRPLAASKSLQRSFLSCLLPPRPPAGQEGDTGRARSAASPKGRLATVPSLKLPELRERYAVAVFDALSAFWDSLVRCGRRGGGLPATANLRELGGIRLAGLRRSGEFADELACSAARTGLYRQANWPGTRCA